MFSKVERSHSASNSRVPKVSWLQLCQSSHVVELSVEVYAIGISVLLRGLLCLLHVHVCMHKLCTQ